jgi:N-acetylglucosamine-6-sulfatase
MICQKQAKHFQAALLFVALSVIIASAQPRTSTPTRLARIPNAKPRNIVFILTDDHRYDALGFLQGQSFVETPHLDALARGGLHFANAFVTTSLCSPSRASILTGLYAHRHRVVDNNNPIPAGTIYFSQYLKQAGYETAFVGKWHMGGEIDDPQPGFDHWVSFKGQGTYLPNPNGFNVNGKKVPQKGYITDELTDYALDWMKSRKGDKPFMLYLSHKGLHVDLAADLQARGLSGSLAPGTQGMREFVAADRHRGRFKDQTFAPPATHALDCCNGLPMWTRNQRNSTHGADFPYHSDLDLGTFYKQYAETLLSVDESVGRVVAALRARGMLDSTLIVYMGDNGFAFGEHGLIDKRTAYEESMRVPMIAHCPELFQGGTKINQVVANIDIAPTVLEAAGLQAPPTLDGRSFISVAQGKAAGWRDYLLYEYYWERNYPQTPTIHALRGDRYKYIRYQGLWDTDELYDLQSDPRETKNLINHPEHQTLIKELNGRLFKTLAASDGLYIPLYPDRGERMNLRRSKGGKAADFPPEMIRQ